MEGDLLVCMNLSKCLMIESVHTGFTRRFKYSRSWFWKGKRRGVARLHGSALSHKSSMDNVLFLDLYLEKEKLSGSISTDLMLGDQAC